MPVYLKGISYELEEPRPLQQLPEIRQSPDLLANLKAVGVECFSASRQSPADLAASCVSRTLWKAKTDPASVDLLFYATSTFGEPSFYGRDVQALIGRLGLVNAYPIGVTLSECANVVIALALAADTLQLGRCRNALVVTTDKVLDGESRVVPPEVSVGSDCAASVLVCGEGTGPWELLATERLLIPLEGEGRAHENFAGYLKMSAQGIQKVTARTLSALGLKPDDFTWLITNNYNQSVARLYASQSGFDLAKVYTANISRYGHCFGADNLINLSDCAGEHPPAAGDLVLLLASGPNMWATAVLRRT
ncbi:MAG TPA: 3-oxoacyl-[acyl-carrier-protein] synthase III C-terminal domain-containing protein [Thermoanaerobaculia bacterium]|nr:3-oxoacyl-[acyl-carrier-protein] synthase III C-terminal domain-containing protein [Thermoanaerobaculia bacterium]